jgi:hypothetical protein
MAEAGAAPAPAAQQQQQVKPEPADAAQQQQPGQVAAAGPEPMAVDPAPVAAVVPEQPADPRARVSTAHIQVRRRWQQGGPGGRGAGALREASAYLFTCLPDFLPFCLLAAAQPPVPEPATRPAPRCAPRRFRSTSWP